MKMHSYIGRIELLDYRAIGLNLLLLVFARQILQLFQHEGVIKSAFLLKVQTFRALNPLIILTYGYNNIYHKSLSGGSG